MTRAHLVTLLYARVSSGMRSEKKLEKQGYGRYFGELGWQVVPTLALISLALLRAGRTPLHDHLAARIHPYLLHFAIYVIFHVIRHSPKIPQFGRTYYDEESNQEIPEEPSSFEPVIFRRSFESNTSKGRSFR